MRLLTLKFRKVSAATKKRVRNASVDELGRYAERILNARPPQWRRRFTTCVRVLPRSR